MLASWMPNTYLKSIGNACSGGVYNSSGDFSELIKADINFNITDRYASESDKSESVITGPKTISVSIFEDRFCLKSLSDKDSCVDQFYFFYDMRCS